MTLNQHIEMVRKLAESLQKDAPSQIIETHISSIILSGDVVYKLKKPVDFGFLDYSTLQRRQTCCEEEVRINRVFAPALYDGIVSINGSAESPSIGGEGDVIDFAVKMRRFDQRSQLDEMAENGTLEVEVMEKAADTIAAFHDKTRRADPQSDYGAPQQVLKPMIENFELLKSAEPFCEKIERLEKWTTTMVQKLEPTLLSRKKDGFIRECHGDLHLHNMTLFEGSVMLFDAIEFNPYLSHIDVISDIAFLLMDLEYRGLYGHAARVLNRYLEQTGDYAALRLLDFYKAYRALVRAKVASLRASQQMLEEERAEMLQEIERYVDLALEYTRDKTPFIGIMHGYSGSGKSTFALMMCERLGAVRIRSDVERMRLRRKNGEDIYTAEANEKTYRRLCGLAREAYEGGYSAIADATFLKRWQRELMRNTVSHFFILTMTCDTALLRERVGNRLREGSDVSEADLQVLETQIARAEPLSELEKASEVRIDCTSMHSMRQALNGFERDHPSFSEKKICSRL